MRTALFAACLVATSAFAQTFTGHDTVSLSVREGRPAAAARAEVVVSNRVVTARHGVTREGSGMRFEPSTAVALDCAYLVRDGLGVEHRLWVREATTQQVVVELEAAPAGQGERSSGRYRLASVTVNGQAASPTFGNLVLEARGRYRLGVASGSWRFSGEEIVLDGGYAAWGHGQTSEAGRALTFTFTRGALSWVIRFELEAEPEAPAVAAR